MSAGPSESTGGQDFDLNIAPIIDCFTVLIAYLLISASFVSIGFFDVSVAAPSTEASTVQPKDPGINLAVSVGAKNSFELKLTGKATAQIQVPAKANGEPDLARLQDNAKQLKAKWPELADASVSADPGVEYLQIVKTVESLRHDLPKVYLSD